MCFALFYGHAFGIVVNYENDNMDRLIRVEQNDGFFSISYTYDFIGNRIAASSTGAGLINPIIQDEGALSINNSTLKCLITTYSNIFGNLTYEFSIGKTIGAGDVLPWVSSNPDENGNVIFSGLSLMYNQQYFVSARIKNFAGDIVTPIIATDGIFILNPIADNDNDGASNQQELNAGTNPFNSDSDNDKIPDGWEIQNQLNPLTDDSLSDKDDDGFSNLREFVSQSNPSDENDLPNCISDYDQDGDVDGYDLSMLIEELGRSDCTPEDPCTCDKYVDGSVNEIEFLFFREDFGRDECQ
jgi:hypothetical protein